jgi:outer membrane lipoprotein-sorting protein
MLMLGAQTMKPATSLFNEVAEQYSNVNDYSANVDITLFDGSVKTVDGKTKVQNLVMTGTLLFKRASRLRIDFTNPEEQVIVSDGKVLQVYIPKYDVTLTQKLDSGTKDSTGGAGMATPQGLELLRKGYKIAYKIGPNTVPLDEGAKGGSSESVYKLLLNWSDQNQGFRQIELSITTNKWIRRIDGITADRKHVRIDFTGLKLNEGIPDIKFEYDAPADSNVYDNFLFGTTN